MVPTGTKTADALRRDPWPRPQRRARLVEMPHQHRMFEHLVRTIAREYLFGLYPVMSGEGRTQLRRLGIGIKPQGIDRGGSHCFERARRRTDRAFVCV